MNWKKIVKRTLVFAGSIFLLFLIAGFIIIRFYEDEVVGYALKRIDAQLKTKAQYETVDLTLWESFPDASLRFTNVYLEETFVEKDTLFFTEKLYLSFNLFDLFRGQYAVSEIETVNSKLFLKLDEKGNDNWHIWNDDEAGDSSKFSFALQNLFLQNADVVYEDRRTKFFLDITSQSSQAKGDFTENEFELTLDFVGKIHSLLSGETEYAAERSLEAKTKIAANTATQHFSFSKCNLSLDGLDFALSGDIDAGEIQQVNILVKGEQLELDEVLAHLPEASRKRLNAYEPAGLISADISIYGETGKDKSPEIVASFELRDGTLKQTENGVALKNLNCKGNYTALKKSEDKLVLHNCQGNLEGGAFEVSGWVENFADPKAQLALKASMDLSDLKNFFAWDTLEVCEGRITADATLFGKIITKEDSTLDLTALTTTGNARLENARLKLKQSSREFSQVNGTFLLNNADASVQELTGVVNGNDFTVNGTLKNMLSYLQSKNEVMTVDASFTSQHIDFSNLVENDATRKQDDYKLIFPARIDFSLNANVEKFTFGKFEATDVKGIARLNDLRLSIDPVSFKTADGSLTSQIILDQVSDDQFFLKSFSNLSGINITKLFAEFDNFGQQTITEKNLRGKATATVQFNTPVSTSLRIVTDKIESLIDIKIENGQLINVKALQDIAEYIRKNKLVAPFVNEEKFAEKMSDIKFSTFENVIEIKNRNITFPMMDVRTTAMDISARGTHSFDNRINYTVGFNLRDILVRKEKEFAEADDGLGRQMFIYMRGTTEQPEFGLDKQASKENRQQEMEVEKQNVKALLKEEFGLFKKNQTVGSYKEETITPGTTSTITWEEMDVKNTPVEEPKKETPVSTEKPPLQEEKKKKKLPKWLEEKEENEKPDGE
ncbi:MAG: AsmA-like C-terminal region-containing protein [Flavobacteriales bacterium]|nr:AsmA-like C-terminal region-containing protein [Flavobacteriales bacterium]